MVVWNAMACALDTAHPSGSQKARELARLIPQFDDWSDPFPLSVRLKLSLLELKLDDTEKALFDMGTLTLQFKCFHTLLTAILTNYRGKQL